MQRRLVVLTVTAFAVLGLAIPSVAEAALAATKPVDTAAWVTKPIRGTNLTVKVPDGWKDMTPSIVPSGDRQVALRMAERIPGDNLIVNLNQGAMSSWYENLSAYKKSAQASVAFSKGKLVRSPEQIAVGSLPAFRHIESYRLSGDAVHYGNMEILMKPGLVVTLSITVGKKNAATVLGVLDSVTVAP
jgi:hypothetical protein